jgi:methylated-DNA-[protein]-cysteine S-methyltransferase
MRVRICVTANQTVHMAFLESELGVLEIAGTADYIIAVTFVEPNAAANSPDQTGLPETVRECTAQLRQYFAGDLQQFSVELEPQGTPFQKRVWDQLTTIPYGSTVTYLDIARAVGNEKAVRAVGAANGQNPISIIVPCHRVIGSDGKLTGYGGGLWRKEWLLKHEGGLPARQLELF